MIRVIVCALVGAVIGGVLLLLVSRIGEQPVVWYPVHQPGTSGLQDAVDYSRLVDKFAAVLGVCSGAIVGSIAGAVAVRTTSRQPGPAP
jgi:hypothetical protein